jgi:hypothetical protein
LEQRFQAYTDNVIAMQVDEKSVILLSQDRLNDMPCTNLDIYDEPDAFSGLQVMSGDLTRV